MKVPYNYLPMEFRRSDKILSHWRKLIRSTDFTLGKYMVEFEKKFSKYIGAKYVILGHSENRSEGDTNQIIKKKIISALNQKLNVIFCIGETYKEKSKGKTFSILRKQIKSSLNKKFINNKIILAYEPVWSIGTNKIPKKSELQDTIKFIKKDFRKIFKTNKSPKVLYGGSVNHQSIGLLSSISEIDGFLIGSASQSAKKFIDIVKNYYK